MRHHYKYTDTAVPTWVITAANRLLGACDVGGEVIDLVPESLQSKRLRSLVAALLDTLHWRVSGGGGGVDRALWLTQDQLVAEVDSARKAGVATIHEVRRAVPQAAMSPALFWLLDGAITELSQDRWMINFEEEASRG